jgi:hypothetical protein
LLDSEAVLRAGFELKITGGKIVEIDPVADPERLRDHGLTILKD